MRSAFAAILVLLAGLLSFTAVAAVWEQRVLMDEAGFVALGQEVLAKPAVQEVLSVRVEREVLDVVEAAGADPDLAESVGRPLVAEIVANLDESPLGEAALRDSHGLLVDIVRNEDAIETENGLIVLDLSAIADQAVTTLGALGVINPRLVPPETGRILLVKEEDFAFPFRMARLFDAVAIHLVALPVILLVIALIISSNRTGTIAFAGFVLLVGALVRMGLLLGPGASWLRDAALIEPSARAAASDAYDVMAASFVQMDLFVAGAGLVLLVSGVILSGLKRFS